jgi:hypothetical protein
LTVKLHFICAILALLAFSTAQAADPYVIPEAVKSCRIWEVPVSSAFVRGNFSKEVSFGTGRATVVPFLDGNGHSAGNGTIILDADSMQVMSLTAARKLNPYVNVVTTGQVALNGDTRAIAEMMARTAVASKLTSGSGNAVCVATGTQSSVISDQLRLYLESEVQKTVKASVDAQMKAFLESLKTVSDADRARMIDKALEELPKNAQLVDALRAAMTPKPTTSP